MSCFGHRSALRHCSGCVLPGHWRASAGPAGIAAGDVTSIIIHTLLFLHGPRNDDETSCDNGKKKVPDFICVKVKMERNSHTQPKEVQTLWKNREGLCNANIKAYIAH